MKTHRSLGTLCQRLARVPSSLAQKSDARINRQLTAVLLQPRKQDDSEAKNSYRIIENYKPPAKRPAYAEIED